jgi:hypothetical protein
VSDRGGRFGFPGSAELESGTGDHPATGAAMNLLALIVIFLAIAIAVAIGYIAWEITSDRDGPP